MKRVLLFGTLISDVTLSRPEKMDEECTGDAGLIAVRCISSKFAGEVPDLPGRGIPDFFKGGGFFFNKGGDFFKGGGLLQGGGASSSTRGGGTSSRGWGLLL